MQKTESHVAALPTGHWLTDERRRLDKRLSDVAQAMHGHISTVRAVEQNNRVVPPGWYAGLRKIGMNVYEPAWNSEERPYCGADLDRDLRTRVGFRHSRYWLSKQLCVPESVVANVVIRNHLIPHSWMLKLAELGANVPASVRFALYGSTQGIEVQEPASPSLVDYLSKDSPDSIYQHFEKSIRDFRPFQGDSKTQAPLGTDSPHEEYDGPKSANGAGPAQDPSPVSPKVAVEEPVAASAPCERSSIYLHWTGDGGLHFSMSAAVLDKIPGMLLEMLVVLSKIELPSAKQGQNAPVARV